MRNAQAHTKKFEKSTFHSYVKFSSDSSNDIRYSRTTGTVIYIRCRTYHNVIREFLFYVALILREHAICGEIVDAKVSSSEGQSSQELASTSEQPETRLSRHHAQDRAWHAAQTLLCDKQQQWVRREKLVRFNFREEDPSGI